MESCAQKKGDENFKSPIGRSDRKEWGNHHRKLQNRESELEPNWTFFRSTRISISSILEPKQFHELSFSVLYRADAPWYQFNATLTNLFCLHILLHISSSSSSDAVQRLAFTFTYDIEIFQIFPLFCVSFLVSFSQTNWRVKIPKCLIIGPHWSKSFRPNVTWHEKIPNFCQHCKTTSLWV